MLGLCLLCTLISVITTFGIIFVLGKETWTFFQQPGITFKEFFTGTEWSPTFSNPKYGILPLISGTAIITVGSALIALPIGLLTAIFLSQYASPGLRKFLKPTLEILAGIPTVVYGYFGLTAVTPVLRAIFPSVEVFNAASGAIVVGIMILPLVTSLCDDALSAVPKSLREGGLALGSTSFEVIRKILIPAALSGIMAGFILAISRAIGETMAVSLAAGSTPKLTLNPAESIETMTAYIVRISKGDTPAGTTGYLTLFAVGFVLFLITLLLNILARSIVRKYRRVL